MWDLVLRGRSVSGGNGGTWNAGVAWSPAERNVVGQGVERPNSARRDCDQGNWAGMSSAGCVEVDVRWFGA